MMRWVEPEEPEVEGRRDVGSSLCCRRRNAGAIVERSGLEGRKRARERIGGASGREAGRVDCLESRLIR